MKKISVLVASLTMLLIAILGQSLSIYAEENSTKINILEGTYDGNGSALDFSSVDTTISISSGVVTISNVTITTTNDFNQLHLIEVEKNATLILNNVTFISGGTITEGYIYNRGRVVINDCNFVEDATHIINASNYEDSIYLACVRENQVLNISLMNNYVYVDASSIILGKINLNLVYYTYEELNDSLLNFEGKVLVKSVSSFAGAYLEHFKLVGALDASSITTVKEYNNLLNKYYIDYAGNFGDDILNDNQGVIVEFGDNQSNMVKTGDIILTKFAMKLNTKNSNDRTITFDKYDDLKVIDNDNGREYFYIGGRYSTARIFVNLLQSLGLDNFRASGYVINMNSDTTVNVEDCKVSTRFALDNVTPLFANNYTYVNYGNTPFYQFELCTYVNDSKTASKTVSASSESVDKNNRNYTSQVFVNVDLLGNQLDSINACDTLVTNSVVTLSDIEVLLVSVTDVPSTAEIDVCLVAVEEEPEYIDVYVDNLSMTYSKEDYLSTSSTHTCHPYYLDNTGNKVYLANSEYSVYQVIDGNEIKVSQIVNAGKYNIYLSSADSKVYYTSEPFQVVITPITLDIDFGKTNFVYTGSEHSLTPNILNVLDGDNVQLTLSNNSFTLPNTYKVNVSTDNTNYALSSDDQKISVFVDKGTITRDQIILESERKTVEYDGNPHTIAMVNSVDGVTAKAPSYTSAGTYNFNVSFSVNSALYYPIDSIPVVLIITPKTIDLNYIEFEDIHRAYDKTAVKVSVNDAILDSLPDEVSKEVSISGDNVINASDTPYEVTISFKLKSSLRLQNYNLVNNVKKMYIYISKIDFDMSQIVFEDEQIIFDGENHCLEFVNNWEDIFIASVSGCGGTNVGHYSFTLYITQKDTINYNPLPQSITASLDILPITIDASNVTFSSATFTYEKDTQFKIQAQNYAELNLDVQYTYYLDGVQLTGDYVENAGVYTVVAKFCGVGIYAGNVAGIDSLTATLTILPAIIYFDQIKFNDATFVYDGKAHTLPQVVSPYNIDIEYSYPKDGYIDAGTYTIIAQPMLNSNYITINNREIKATLTITPAKYDMSSIKFNNINVSYDGTYHTALIKGKLPEGVSCTYSNNSYKNVGSYIATVHFSVEDSHNYQQIEDMTCSIIISARVVDIMLVQDRFVYTGNPIAPIAQITSGIISTDECFATATNTTQVDCGTYYTAVQLSNNNYRTNKATYKFVIDKARVDMSQVEFKDVVAQFDGHPHTPTLVGTFPVGIIPNIVGGNLINVGEYVVYVDFTVVNNNYIAPDRLSAKVVINKKPILLQFSGYTGLIEDGKKKDINVEFLGVLESPFDGYTKIYSSEPINAGTYTLNVELTSKSNYYISGTSSISFEILTTSKSYINSNMQVKIESDGFSANSDITIENIEDDKINSQLKAIGVNFKSYNQFKILVDNADSKDINVTLKTNTINLSNANRIKVYTLKDGNLEQIEHSIVSGQLVFNTTVGDEIVLVEEMEESNNTIWIVAIVASLVLIAGITAFTLIKRKKRKQVDYFIEN